MSPDDLFQEVIEEHEQALFDHALHTTHGRREDAQDACQEGLLRVWRAPGRAGWARTFLVAVLFRAVRHCAIEAHRRRTAKRTDPLHRAASGDALYSAQGPPPLLPPDLEHIFDAVRALPAPLRQVVEHVIDGWSVAEIANALGLTVNAIHIRLCRARALLRGLLG